MIKLSVMYPQDGGQKFDERYYLNEHLALVREKWGHLMKDAYVTRGVSGGSPDMPAPYRMMAHFSFASIEDLKSAMASGGELFADIPNFTDIRPTVQVSEVLA